MPKKSAPKKEDNIQALLLIDSSYTAFYRFFATIRWYSFAFADEFKELKSNPNYNWIENHKFMEKYEKMFLKSIMDLVKKKVFTNSRIIFCMDTPKEHLWRTELDCAYKSDRADLSLKHDFKPVFAYTYDTMIPNFIKENTNISKLRVDKMEADDVIASITLHLKETEPNRIVYIVTGDEDFLQLGRDSVIFANYKAKKPFKLTEIEAIKALRHKIIMGDKSDCIKGIFPKGSKVKKQDIIDSDEKLEDYLASNSEAKKQYEFNKKMIDFNNIPKKYVSKVIVAFEAM